MPATATATAAPPPPAVTGGLSPTYEFDAGFQTKIAAMAVRDADFLARTEGLCAPDYFENVAEGHLVSAAIDFFRLYRKSLLPSLKDTSTLIKVLKDRLAVKMIPVSLWPDVKVALGGLLTADISDKEFVIDEVATFARHQATAAAILESVSLLDKRNFIAIDKMMREALEVGKNLDVQPYDYYDAIAVRTHRRLEAASGLVRPSGLTTGVGTLDNLLYHKGLGRKELTVFMGGAKVGKTTLLINLAKNMSLSGLNVLYATLEVSKEIISDRADAGISSVLMKELGTKIHDVEAAIKALGTRPGLGKFIIHEFPTGTLRPSDLRRLIQFHERRGTKFDAVFVDYADIMAPDFRTMDSVENSKSIFVGLRALATEFDVAMVTATQTNRTGYTAAVAKAEHVAEDFNKVRIADLIISINMTDEERGKGEVRLYFAASRNQAGAFSIRLKTDLERMQFLGKVLAVET